MTEPVLKQVLHPTADVAAAVAFYAGALELPVKFQDGDRYAALDAGGVTLGLTGGAEDITDGRPAAAFRVTDVEQAVARVFDGGGTIVRGPETGPHEIRAVVSDPWGNLFVLHSPLSAS